MSLFTQWVPHTWSDEPHTGELDAYADRVIDGYTELAPNFKQSILHRQVIGPYEMEHDYGLVGGNIFHGELSTEQLFHMRPAPGYADFTTPIRASTSARRRRTAAVASPASPRWHAARASWPTSAGPAGRALPPSSARRLDHLEPSARSQLMDRSPAAAAVEEVEASLRPFGHSRMLPRAAYTDPAVLAWEREHFFAGAWVCAGRLADLAEPRARRRCASGTTACSSSAATTARCARSPTCAATAVTSCCRAVRRPSGARSTARTTRGSTTSTARCARPRASTDAHGFDSPRSWACCRCPRRVERLGVGERVGRRGPFADHLGALDALVAPYECERLVVGATHEYTLQANWKLPSRTTTSATTAR